MKQTRISFEIVIYLSFEIERYFESVHAPGVAIINTIIQKQA